jgi:hypothetical protein
MSSIDSALLDLTERCSRRFQLLTGRTNVWLAVQLTNLSIIVYFIWAAGLYFSSADVVLRLFVAFFCGGVLLALTRTIFKVSVEAYEAEAYRRVAKGLRNPRRLRDAQLRIAFLTLAVLLAYPVLFVYVTLHIRIALLTYSLIVLTTVVLYLLACDPLAPCPGKLREWLRDLGLYTARSRAVGAGTDPVRQGRTSDAAASRHGARYLAAAGSTSARSTPGAGSMLGIWISKYSMEPSMSLSQCGVPGRFTTTSPGPILRARPSLTPTALRIVAFGLALG